MEKLTHIRSKTLVLAQPDIDTDQIMPARFLTTTTREGLGDALFADWRFDDSGNPLADFPLNDPDAADCRILVAGNNFGCGSSREHAPWGLVDFGFSAVISTQFADIFKNNALKNGLVPVVVDTGLHEWLLDNPGTLVSIDVATATLTLADGRSSEFPLDGFAQHCLLEGIDQLGFLRSKETEIAAFEQARTWKP